MKTEKIERVRIFVNQEAVDKVVKDSNLALPILQNVIDEAKMAGLEVTNENLTTAISAPDLFIEEQHMEQVEASEDFKMQKMPVGRYIKNYEPQFADTSTFVEATKRFKDLLRASGPMVMIKKEKAVIDQDSIDKFEEANSLYLLHPSSAKIWESINKIYDSIDATNEILKEHNVSSVGINLENFNQYSIRGPGGKLIPHTGLFRSLVGRLEIEAGNPRP